VVKKIEERQNLSFQQLFHDQMIVPNKLLTSYHALGLNEHDLTVILIIFSQLQKGNEFPTPAEISSHLTVDENRCIQILRKLIEKKLIIIEESKNDKGQLSEAYNLNPLWEKIFNKDEEIVKKENEGTIFILFEQEFGRPLSPFEIETINAWLDEDRIIPALIKAALRESVLMGKLNFKYIDRILREWKRKGIQTVEQARNEGKSFRTNQVKKQYEPEQRDTSVYFNWLDGGN